MTPNRLLPWGLRAAWVVLPVSAGPALGTALHRHSPDVRLVASGALWAGWALVLVATLVPHPVSLTVLRVAAPAAVIAAIAAVASGRPSALSGGLALATTLLAAAVAFAPATGTLFVNGAAYPNERRYLLRVPGLLLLGPVELAWMAAVVTPAAGLLLLAAHQWVLGGVVTAVSVPAAVIAARSLYTLSQRWVVFVPAGLVLRDPLGLDDPVLFRRAAVASLHPAPADTDSLDLTQRATGLALELVLREKVAMSLSRPGRRVGEPGASARLLFTPTRPGAVLAMAGERRLPVG